MSKDRQPVRFDFSSMTAQTVGADDGIDIGELEEIAPRLKDAVRTADEGRNSGDRRWRQLPHAEAWENWWLEDMLATVSTMQRDMGEDLEYLVVLGIGGSALGTRAVHCALNHPNHSLLTRKNRSNLPVLLVMDNVDPELWNGMRDVVDPQRAVFNVVTKSGSTAETLAQLVAASEWLKEAVGSDYAERVICTTGPEGTLRRIAEAEGMRTFPVPVGVGGRYSVLSPVGLLPAALLGVEVRQMLQGAADMDKLCSVGDPLDNPAAVAAGLLYLADTRKEKHVVVMMPYCHCLAAAADWFCQLWAESLGKTAPDGSLVGSTPMRAIGVTDQHSLMQLFMQGPRDKVILFLVAEEFRTDCVIPAVHRNEDACAYLGGQKLGVLLDAERRGARAALRQEHRPSADYVIPELDAYYLGQFFYLLEVQTDIAGQLYAINPFDQPGVQQGKDNTYALMGRPGYEELRRQLEEAQAPCPECIVPRPKPE